jgi:hypothetical protein
MIKRGRRIVANKNAAKEKNKLLEKNLEGGRVVCEGV